MTLQERIAVLETETASLVDQLAEREVEIAKLRDVLKSCVAAVEYRWEHIANRASPVWETEIDAVHTKGIEALSTPPSTSYLEMWEKSKYGEPVAYMFSSGAITKLDIWKHGGNWFPLYARKESK